MLIKISSNILLITKILSRYITRRMFNHLNRAIGAFNSFGNILGWEQALLQNKGRETHKDFPTKWISQIFLNSWTVVLRNRHFLDPAEKIVFLEKVFQAIQVFNFKMLYGINLLRVFKFILGRFSPYFFFTWRIFLGNLPGICHVIPLFYGSYTLPRISIN